VCHICEQTVFLGRGFGVNKLFRHLREHPDQLAAVLEEGGLPSGEWSVLIYLLPKDLNDDLSSTLTVHQVAETRSIIDCPINDPDAILQIMFSGRHISVNWKIMG